jgi:two-component system LytT family response regulator
MRLLIVDQEPGERAALTQLCRSNCDIDDVAFAESGSAALEQIRTRKPDAVLLQCELQDMTGFDVLRTLPRDQRPAAIMVAADERYAMEAFATAVVDYLTKPLILERFNMAIQRVSVLAHQTFQCGAAPWLLSEAAPYPVAKNPQALALGCGDRLVGERCGRLYFLAPQDVDYIEADSNYVTIHTAADRYINRDSLTRLSPLLEGYGFVRISRSLLVNLRRVEFAERRGRGVLAFVLGSGVRLLSSAGHRLKSGAELRVERSRALHGPHER